MAIYPNTEALASHEAAVDVESWAEQAIASLSITEHANVIPAPTVPLRGSSVTLSIPLDTHPSATKQHKAKIADASDGEGLPAAEYVRRDKLLRRDSLKRREALLKGREGSRRRQRWENDRLLNNPALQPPLPSDWEVHPTYTVKHVPYVLAGLWDAELAARTFKRQETSTRRRKSTRNTADDESARVLRDLKETLKRARGAKPLLQDLESQVRRFVENWEAYKAKQEKEAEPEVDSEDEEIVFVGRNGQMRDIPSEPSSPSRRDSASDNLYREALIFETADEENGARFARWLVHSIGAYYGLRTWSATVGETRRKGAYVGIKETGGDAGFKTEKLELPRPLWGLV